MSNQRTISLKLPLTGLLHGTHCAAHL